MLIILLLAGAITGLKMYLVEQFGPTPDPKYEMLSSLRGLHDVPNFNPMAGEYSSLRLVLAD